MQRRKHISFLAWLCLPGQDLEHFTLLWFFTGISAGGMALTLHYPIVPVFYFFSTLFWFSTFCGELYYLYRRYLELRSQYDR